MKHLHAKKILVPTDFSETGTLAIDHAAFIAKLLKADLFIIHIIDKSDFSYDIVNPQIKIENIGAIADVVEKKLADIANHIKDKEGINVTTFNSVGKASKEIVKIAEEYAIDLIIMGTHGANGFEEAFIGSNAYRVVSMAQCPVITVQTQATRLGFNNIVLPIDNSIHSRQKVDYTIEFAKKFAAKVHVVEVLNDDAEKNKLDIKVEAVEKAVKKAGLSFVHKTVKSNNLAIASKDYALEAGCDLIVVMADEESELPGGFFFNTYAKQIVNHSRIPVLSIKPHIGEYESLHLGGTASPY